MRTAASRKCFIAMTSYQKDVVKDFRGTVHLSQDDDHLVVDELLKLPQITDHLHLQLCSDLRGDDNKSVQCSYWKHFAAFM